MRHGLAGCVAIIGLWASVWWAGAQTLAVQAGEHAGFTRIVVRIGEDRQWDLQETDRAFRLSLSPDIDGFDLSESFDLIQRDRIADLRSDGADLSAALACACEVTAFRYLDRFLVIDVADPASAPSEAVAGESDATNTAREEALRAQRAAAAAALPDLASVLTGGPSVLPRPGSTTEPGGNEATAEDAAPRPSDPVPELEEAARIMAEQLARAAAAGLLSPAENNSLAFADPIGVEPPALSTEAPDVASLAPSLEAPSIALPPGQPVASLAIADTSQGAIRTAPELPLRAQTALDVAVAPILDASSPISPLSCSGAAMAIQDWAVSEDVTSALGDLRLALFDDRDRLVDAAALRLARHYLAYGFGAEAQFWLARVAVPPHDLNALAELIEGGTTTPYTQITDTAACSDEEFLFRFLGGAVGAILTEAQVNRAQRGFASLPMALQDRFGPDLARRLATGGHVSAARNIRDALHRSGRLPSALLIAVDLEIGIDIDAGQARLTLDSALRDDGATPAPAMAQALALDRSEGLSTDPARVTAAAGLLRETPEGPEADALWRELVAAQARLGEIDTVISMLDVGRATHANVWQQAVTEVLSDRLDAGDSATLLLLAHLFGPDWTAGGSRAGRVRAATAERLLAADLETAAAMILANGPGLILPEGAPPVPPEQDQRTLWAGGDWIDIARGVDGPHSDLARRMAGRDGAPDVASEPDRGINLDTLAAEVADSSALRRTVTAVLATRLIEEAPQ
jgi:hypothetical protein